MIEYILYINLSDYENRKKHIKSILAKNNIPYQRIPGIRLEVKDIEKDRLHWRTLGYIEEEEKIPRGLGIVGCYKAHYNALIKCSRIRSKNYICIIEDDVNFNPQDIKYINNILNDLDKKYDWDMYRILHKKSNVKKLLNKKLIKKFFLEKNYVYKFTSPNGQSKYCQDEKKCNPTCGGSHLQIINKKNIDKIINYMDNELIYNIDSVYSTDKLNIYFNTSDSITSGIKDKSSIPKL